MSLRTAHARWSLRCGSTLLVAQPLLDFGCFRFRKREGVAAARVEACLALRSGGYTETHAVGSGRSEGRYSRGGRWSRSDGPSRPGARSRGRRRIRARPRTRHSCCRGASYLRGAEGGRPAPISREPREAVTTLFGDVAAHLDSKDVPYAVIGAAALALHGVSRSTGDQDLLVTDSAVLAAGFWESLERSTTIDVRRGDDADPLARRRLALDTASAGLRRPVGLVKHVRRAAQTRHGVAADRCGARRREGADRPTGSAVRVERAQGDREGLDSGCARPAHEIPFARRSYRSSRERLMTSRKPRIHSLK